MNNKIEQVDWAALFPPLKLVKTGGEALQPGRMLLAILGVAAVAAAAQLLHLAGGGEMREIGVVAGEDGHISFWATKGNWDFLIFPWMVICALIFGGPISRLAAIRIAAGQSGRLHDAHVFLSARGRALLGAAGLVLLPFVLLAIPLVLGGLAFFSASWTSPIGAVLFGAALLIGVVFAILAFLALPASLFIVPAIAVDGYDGFDAPGRSVSYVVSRPWQLGLHLATLAAFGCVFVGLALGIERFAVQVTEALVQAGSRNGVFEDAVRTSSIIAFWKSAAFAVVLAYAFSFFVTGLTRIYFLIRESADGVPETDLWQPSDDKKVTMGVDEK